MWSDDGSDERCKAATGGELFYAYNYPVTASSNTGFETAEEILFYFVVNDENRISFVVVNDKPGTVRPASDHGCPCSCAASPCSPAHFPPRPSQGHRRQDAAGDGVVRPGQLGRKRGVLRRSQTQRLQCYRRRRWRLLRLRQRHRQRHLQLGLGQYVRFLPIAALLWSRASFFWGGGGGSFPVLCVWLIPRPPTHCLPTRHSLLHGRHGVWPHAAQRL